MTVRVVGLLNDRRRSDVRGFRKGPQARPSRPPDTRPPGPEGSQPRQCRASRPLIDRDLRTASDPRPDGRGAAPQGRRARTARGSANAGGPSRPRQWGKRHVGVRPGPFDIAAGRSCQRRRVLRQLSSTSSFHSHFHVHGPPHDQQSATSPPAAFRNPECIRASASRQRIVASLRCRIAAISDVEKSSRRRSPPPFFRDHPAHDAIPVQDRGSRGSATAGSGPFRAAVAEQRRPNWPSLPQIIEPD